MMYLPRLCEHCLNPSCVASCPSGAIYKREDDGVVLIDQEKCRGWRMCVSGCPYKKIYYNWSTGKSEKCTLCYPRLESGQPTVCSETCVGRIRYLGVMLYDADRIAERAVSVETRRSSTTRSSASSSTRTTPKVIEAARAEGVPEDWIEGRARSPIWKMAMEWKIAFPLHPEYRTLPMVWYVPPLADPERGRGRQDRAQDDMPDVRSLRIPVRYLANMLTAGDEAPIVSALERMLAMRSYMRSKTVDGVVNLGVAKRVGMTPRRSTRCTS
jgi:nitrate reductase / nitrite oxidoreductase, beta subunit